MYLKYVGMVIRQFDKYAVQVRNFRGHVLGEGWESFKNQ